jgi:Tol biopolymer transport system component
MEVIGRRLGSYEVTAKLGEGGMGEVFRARDSRLHRDVAIKVLPALFASDPDRLARFEREAQVLASLNHGNIAHVYGVIDSPPALVMELVEGRTLDALIPAGGMAIREALGLAIQLADALAAAHAAGVVHRDFKPGNVVVTPNGTAKVLDFGLAKALQIEGPGGAETALATAPRTAAGMVLGTVAYMSPEQAAGRHVDARSDVFSFGSVLFELVTGRRPFDRDTSMSTLAAIINEPAQPVTQVNARIPRDLERLIVRCHRKDPGRRVQSMADLRSALEELRDELDSSGLSGSVAVPVIRPRARVSRYAGLAAAAIALIAAGAAAARFWLTPAPQPDARYRLDAMTSDLGVTTDPAVTANGDLLAYASDRHDGTNLDIWVQPTAGGEPVRVTTHPGDDRTPAFSPDGSRIAFRSERDGGGIYVVPALGGAERLLVPFGREPLFSPDGKWLLYSTGGRGSGRALFVMPAAGGTPQPVLAGYSLTTQPAWAPDSQSILIRGRWPDQDVAQLFRVDIDGNGVRGGPPRDTGVLAAIRAAGISLRGIAGWRGDELLVLGQSGAMDGVWRVRIDGGPAAAVLQVHGGTEDISHGVVASDGRIFFSSSRTRAAIAAIQIDGTRTVAAPPVELTRSVAIDRWPSLSADGGKLAFSSNRVGGRVWFREIASGRETPLPVPNDAYTPVISPDGRSVAYSLLQDAVLAVVDTRGGIPREICRGCARYVASWSADGQYILGNNSQTAARAVPVAIHVATGKATLIASKGPAWFPRLSPDQRWVTFFEWPHPDRTREIVAPYTLGSSIEDAARIPVTEGQSVDESAVWSADGRVLYFTSERDGFRCVYASGFDPGAGKVTGSPEPILHMHGNRRTLIDTASDPGRIDRAGNRLVFSVQEVVGNIWSLTPGPR